MSLLRLELAASSVLLAAWMAGAQTFDAKLWATDGTVNAVAVSGGTIYIGGDFHRVAPATGGGAPIDAATGALPAAFPRVTGEVRAVAADGAGGWYIGGSFTHVGAVPRSNLAHVAADFSVLDWDPSASGAVLVLTVFGATVYAAVFRSGNRTTVIPEGAIPDGAMPGPVANVEGVPAPPSSLIVKYDGAAWRDHSGAAWNDAVRFSLPDRDVFAIDANATPPREIRSWSGVGTVLFGMAVNPATGRVYVSNTEARNDVRFEGRGSLAGNSLRGRRNRQPGKRNFRPEA